MRVTNWKHKRSVKRRYDSTAEMYDQRYADEQERKYQAALEDVSARGTILDVGCGTGLFFRYIQHKAEEVVGIDLSGQLLRRARDRAKTFGNVSLVQADADHLPFTDRKFIAVFAFTVIQNLPKPLETLKEIYRVAHNGSNIIVTGLKKSFSLENLEQLLKDADLRLVLVKNDEKLACYVIETLKGN